MRLTTDQIAEVDKYLYELAKYRETFHELKDHVLTALGDSSAPSFHMQLVKAIVEEDFGGRESISTYESSARQHTSKRFFSLLTTEILNTFRWPGVLTNLPNFAICAILYYAHQPVNDMASSPMIKAIYIVLYLPALFYLYQRFVVDRYKKESIVYTFLQKVSVITILFGTVILMGIGYSQIYFDYNTRIELLLLLFVFMVTSVFTRTYLKLYKDKIKILVA